MKNVHGNYYSTETLAENQHVVRLFEFIPGKVLAQITPCDNLYYQCGEYLGKMTSAMQVRVKKRKKIPVLTHFVSEFQSFRI
jgi:Ser/Thr protein kinase RdoA (MazF antagonist)